MSEELKAEDILNDSRDVLAIGCSLIDSPDWEVGRYGVEKIEMYRQGAYHCDVPWFAIWVGGEIVARVNGLELAFVRYR